MSTRVTSRSGQALVETIVALVAAVVLTAAIVQLATIAAARIRVLGKAREQAGEHAFTELTVPANADLIAKWDEGPDKGRYSKDDVFTSGNTVGLRNTIVDKAVPAPADWGIIAALPSDPLTPLRAAPDPADNIGLVEGHDKDVVPLLPAFRSLLYDAPFIELDEHVWMVTSRGIY